MTIEKILKIAILVAHDHLHKNEIKEAHEALHLGLNGKEADHSRVSYELKHRLQQFSEDFNYGCLRYNIPSAWFSLIPTTVEDKGKVSVQMGGDPELIKFMRESFGLDKAKDEPIKKESRLVGLDGKSL